eukprot:6280360-Prorocentrum_lima.AAC.1
MGRCTAGREDSPPCSGMVGSCDGDPAALCAHCTGFVSFGWGRGMPPSAGFVDGDLVVSESAMHGGVQLRRKVTHSGCP